MSTPAFQPETRYCVGCGYVLIGLDPAGNCPECGTAIERSLREPILANCSDDYLKSLRGGLSLVLNGILLSIVMVIVGAFSNLMFPNPSNMTMVMSAVGLGISMMMMLGYWRFTVPDPGHVALEATNSARAVIRVVVATQSGLAAAHLLVGALLPSMATLVQYDVAMPLAFAAALLRLVLYAVHFFAVMRYVRWLASRIPDPFVVARTKRYMWLLPVLYVPGAIILMLGPLIALILYWNLLDRVRKHLKHLIEHGVPVAHPGV